MECWDSSQHGMHHLAHLRQCNKEEMVYGDHHTHSLMSTSEPSAACDWVGEGPFLQGIPNHSIFQASKLTIRSLLARAQLRWLTMSSHSQLEGSMCIDTPLQTIVKSLAM